MTTDARPGPLPTSNRNDTGVVLRIDVGDPADSWYGAVLRSIERAAPTVAHPVDELTDTARDELVNQLSDLGSTRTVIDLTPRRGGHSHVLVTVRLSGERKVVEEGAGLGPTLRKALRATRRASASSDRAGP